MSVDSPAIRAINLSKIYGSGQAEVMAMKDVSFTMSNGEVVALLGPSGAGKSTLLTIVGLVNSPTSGKLIIGEDIITDGPIPKVNLRSYRRRFIGYVLQKANLIPFLNAVENVQLALEINDISGKRAKLRAIQLLESLDVGHRAGNLPHMVSGGEHHGVAVARALANRPRLVLADEPTAALDSVRGRQVMQLFRDVAHKYGTTVMVATHDHRSLDIFDRILEMEDGRLKDENSGNVPKAV